MKLKEHTCARLLGIEERDRIHCGHFFPHAPVCVQQALSPVLPVAEVRGEVHGRAAGAAPAVQGAREAAALLLAHAHQHLRRRPPWQPLEAR